MPISYSIDEKNAIIHEIWTGDITITDLNMYLEEILKNENALFFRKTLVDMRESTINFTGEELDESINTIILPRLAGRDWKTAIIVAKAVHFGVSRQYHVFAEHYSKDSIFFDPDEAFRWLMET